jgi:protease IV
MDTENKNNSNEALIRDVVMFAHEEQRRARRWITAGRVTKTVIFFCFIIVAYFIGGRDSSKTAGGTSGTPHIAYVEVVGAIGQGGLADADKLIPALKRAFVAKHSKAIVLKINSGGGSPVHSNRVFRQIMLLKKEHTDKKVYAVVDDIGASGAYYIASAADVIIADPTSIVGSIGVISSSFGYKGLIDKVGIERRVLTAGANKNFLDPYKPMLEKDEMYMKSVLAEIHDQFIKSVREGRGDRLKETPDMFSGLIWTGEGAIKHGLVDQLGDIYTVASLELSEEEKKENLVNYSARPDLMKQLFSRASLEFQQVFSDSWSLK